MNKKKGRSVKWHVSYGLGPRINIEKLIVFNNVIASNSEMDKQVSLRIKDAKIRKVPISITDKEYGLMAKDIRENVSFKESPTVGIFLFGEGTFICEFISKSVKAERIKVREKQAESEKKKTKDPKTPDKSVKSK